MTAEATYLTGVVRETWKAASAYSAGQVILTPSGRVGVVEGLQAIAIGDEVSAIIQGILEFTAASATTFAVGNRVDWDDTNGTTIAVGTGTAASVWSLGVVARTKTSGQTVVAVAIFNTPVDGPRPVAIEFDCETGQDSTTKTLIPASQNGSGLLIRRVFALVTEVFAGSSEDQGIVTVKDSSENTIATLTASDSAADAANDVIVGYEIGGASTGDAAKIVAAGAAVVAVVTQATSGGSPAGKMRVYVDAVPLA